MELCWYTAICQSKSGRVVARISDESEGASLHQVKQAVLAETFSGDLLVSWAVVTVSSEAEGMNGKGVQGHKGFFFLSFFFTPFSKKIFGNDEVIECL